MVLKTMAAISNLRAAELSAGEYVRVLWSMVSELRSLDELDLDGIYPAAVFDPRQR